MHVLLKISGEVLSNQDATYDCEFITRLCQEIATISQRANFTISIVVGGGNMIRGVDNTLPFLKTIHVDYIGMLSTISNSLILSASLKDINVPNKVLSAIAIDPICEQYSYMRAQDYIKKNIINIFAGGLGIPLFSTDTTAVSRGIEMGCDVVLKGTKVDGVYDADPIKNPHNRKKFYYISYDDILDRGLKVMDDTAICLAKKYNMPIRIFSIKNPTNITAVIDDKMHATLIGGNR